MLKIRLFQDQYNKFPAKHPKIDIARLFKLKKAVFFGYYASIHKC